MHYQQNNLMVKYNTNPLYLVRFIAAFLILIYHFYPAELQDKYHFRNLNEAVNFFFFISGFVMVVSNKSYFLNNENPNLFSKSRYWVKRVARIYPSYLLALLLVILFNYTVQAIYPSIPSRSMFEVLGIQRWIYGGSINFPAWTVSTEFFFYLLFPFTTAWLAKTNIAKLATISLAILVCSIIITASIGFIFVDKQHSKTGVFLLGAIYRHPIFEYAIFLFGNICGICYIKNISFGLKGKFTYTLLAVFSILFIAAALYFSPPQNPLIAGGIVTPLYFILVISLCRMQGIATKILSSKFFILLGDISFGVYIFQIPVFLFFDHYSQKHNADLAFSSVPAFSLFCFALVVFCVINYYIYEMPLKNFILSLYKRHNTKHVSIAKQAYK